MLSQTGGINSEVHGKCREQGHDSADKYRRKSRVGVETEHTLDFRASEAISK